MKRIVIAWAGIFAALSAIELLSCSFYVALGNSMQDQVPTWVLNVFLAWAAWLAIAAAVAVASVLFYALFERWPWKPKGGTR